MQGELWLKKPILEGIETTGARSAFRSCGDFPCASEARFAFLKGEEDGSRAELFAQSRDLEELED